MAFATAPSTTGAPSCVDADPLRFCEVLHPSLLRAETALSVHGDGRLRMQVTLPYVDASGVQISVVVLLYDAAAVPEWIWSSPPVRFGIDGPLRHSGSLTVDLQLQLDEELLRTAAHVSVKHFCSPHDAWTDAKDWLRAAQATRSGYVAAQPTLQGLRRCPCRRALTDEENP